MNKILIVDDEAELLDLFSMEAEDRNYETFQATSGEQALEMAREVMPDVILMDRNFKAGMMDGVEATRRLKTDPATKDIGIVILTAAVMPREWEEGIASGCDHWEEKPPDYDRLFSVIEGLIRRRPK